jgi:hypothetical protein
MYSKDWDATVIKIVDNPISIRQAFWSPYRKFSNWITEKITKKAEEKESKSFDDMTAKADNATEKITVQKEGTVEEKKVDEKKAQMFDIAKFAGIFAAIGLALGAIGAALATLGGFVTAKWYNILILVGAIVILISGPSMLLAWLKLRKRNLGPLLNANGWAINSMVKINTTFGQSLTARAKYPKVVGKDPFADKKMAWWKKCLIWLIILLVAAFAVLFFTHNLPWQKKDVAPTATETQVVESAPAAQDAPTAPEGDGTVAGSETGEDGE